MDILYAAKQQQQQQWLLKYYDLQPESNILENLFYRDVEAEINQECVLRTFLRLRVD